MGTSCTGTEDNPKDPEVQRVRKSMNGVKTNGHRSGEREKNPETRHSDVESESFVGEKGKKNEGYGVAGGEELLTCGRST
jgi:hypothetical protein